MGRIPGLLAAIAAVIAPAAAPAADDRGIEVQLNGGLLTFPGEVDVDTGAAYGISLGFEPLGFLGVELGYQGAAYSEDDALDAGESIGAVENGGYGALKVSPIGGPFEPYVLGGVGISHLNVRDGAQPGGALQDDTITKVPVAAGFDVHIERFTAGVRGTYDFLFNNENAFRSASERGDDQLIGTLHLGAQF